MRSSTDRLCSEYAAKETKITVKSLPQDSTYILIEGDQAAFEFLGKLFSAHANGEDCGFQISPHSAGKSLFSESAELGLYLHRLPCMESKK